MQPCTSASTDPLDIEEALDDDSEQEIAEDDKTYIFAVITRLRRILNWDPGEDDEIYDRSRGVEIIRGALSRFFRWKEFIYESTVPEMPRIQHLIIYSLAKLCFYYWIRDSNLVAEILREVYDCDRHFSSMFAHVVNRYDRRSLWRQSTEYSRKKENAATLFFVHHAYKARLRFHGVRFVDVRLLHPLCVPPAFLATIYNKPSLLLQLLRYGAKLQIRLNGMSDQWNLCTLLRHLVRIMWNSFGEHLEQVDLNSYLASSLVISRSTHDVAECFSILLRAIPQVRMGEMNFHLMKFRNGILEGSVSSHDFIRLLSETGLIPKLVNRYLEPSDLCHLSRCVIRENLNRTWNLPQGVNSLPLPKSLKAYLSLLKN